MSAGCHHVPGSGGDLALILLGLMLVLATLAWLRVDATEEIIPEGPVAVPEGAVPAWS